MQTIQHPTDGPIADLTTSDIVTQIYPLSNRCAGYNNKYQGLRLYLYVRGSGLETRTVNLILPDTLSAGLRRLRSRDRETGLEDINKYAFVYTFLKTNIILWNKIYLVPHLTAYSKEIWEVSIEKTRPIKVSNTQGIHIAAFMECQLHYKCIDPQCFKLLPIFYDLVIRFITNRILYFLGQIVTLQYNPNQLD